MTGPFAEALRLLGKGVSWILADPARVQFVQVGGSELLRKYVAYRDLKDHRTEILKPANVAAASATIKATVDGPQEEVLRQIWESALASRIATPLPPGEITLVIEVADKVSDNPAISQLLNGIAPADGQDLANRRMLFVITLFFVYLAAVAGLEARDWDHHLGTAAVLAHAVLSARSEKPETPPEPGE